VRRQLAEAPRSRISTFSASSHLRDGQEPFERDGCSALLTDAVRTVIEPTQGLLELGHSLVSPRDGAFSGLPLEFVDLWLARELRHQRCLFVALHELAKDLAAELATKNGESLRGKVMIALRVPHIDRCGHDTPSRLVCGQLPAQLMNRGLRLHQHRRSA
jgi:hypothetical protein